MSKTMRYLNDNWHGIIYYLKKKNCIDFYVQYLQSKKKDDKRFEEKTRNMESFLFYSMWGLLGCVLINTCYYSIQFTRTYIYI